MNGLQGNGIDSVESQCVLSAALLLQQYCKLLLLDLCNCNPAKQACFCSDTLYVHTDPDSLPSFADECNFGN